MKSGWIEGSNGKENMLAEWCRAGWVGFGVGEFSSILITNQGFHNHLVGGSRLEVWLNLLLVGELKVGSE